MLVDVIVDQPLNRALTYKLTAADLPSLDRGSVVLVPLGRGTALGVVSRLRRKVALPTEKLKTIDRVLMNGPWVPAATIALAEEMSRQSAQPLGTCLFRLLPPFGRRPLHSSTATRPHPSTASHQEIHLVAPQAERHAQLASLSTRAITKDRQVLIVTTKSQIASLERLLKEQGLHVLPVSGELSTGKQQRAAQAFRDGSATILLGTRQCIGWPAQRLGLLIVEDCVNFGHEDDQRPYLDSATIARLRGQGERCHLVLSTALPTLGMRLAERQRRARTILSAGSASVRLRHGHNISNIELTAGRTLIIAPRSGIGGQFRCSDCDQIVTCPACHGELNADEKKRLLHCYDCGKDSPWPLSCTNCNGARLSIHGIGVEAIRSELHQKLGGLPSNLHIDTEAVLSESTRYDTILFVAADSPLMSPSLKRPFRFIGAIREALDRAHTVIIETRHPERVEWQLLKSNPLPALDRLLDERRNAMLPPFRRTISLNGPPSQKLQLPISTATTQIDLPPRAGHVMIDLLVPRAEYGAMLTRVSQNLPRGWVLKTDSILD